MKKHCFFCFVFVMLFSLVLTGDQESVSDQEPLMNLQAGSYVSISPTAVKPYLSDDYAYTFWGTATEFYFQSTGGNMVTPMAPVYLPHGVTVTGFGVSYTDNGDGIDDSMVFSLVRHDILTGATESLASCTTDTLGFPSSPNRRTLKDVTISHAYINNYRYTYCLYVKFYTGSDRVKFHGAVISYN
ncbi:MAG: hypothetical protein JXB23_12555 [Candidatus Aminicenantes bacterium]|nr:hypothetical protein [Candidatus Aminicenantes bacterium]